MWEWDGEFVLQEDVPQSLWNDVNQNEEHLSYMFDEITPVKACGDLGYHNRNSGDASTFMKENTGVKCKSNSSQVKRRRMLKFDEALPIPYCNEEMPPTLLKSKDKKDTLEEAFSNVSQWVFGEDSSSSSYEGLDQSSEGWLANCLNDAEMQLNTEDMDRSGASEAEVQNSGLHHTLPEHEASTVQKRCPQSRKNIIFKGKKSYMQTPTKATSSVVYPFAFIKPCGFHGDVTLRDINQRIHTPPKPKQDEDLSALYPTSAFSGKPVVEQMKIHTEGGKGCIMIMRTKG